MFDGNVIYEMNPVGEINVPQEDKKPNMNDDGKGKISIATGSSGGIRYVECHYDGALENIQCELSAQQIFDLYNSGKFVVLKIISNTTLPVEGCLYPFSHTPNISPIPEELSFSNCTYYGSPANTLVNYSVTVSGDGTITGKINNKHLG